MILNTRFRVAYCLFAAVASLLSPAVSMAQENTISLRVNLTTLAWENPVSELYYLNNGKTVELKAYSGGFSMPFSYEGDATIQFYSDKASLSLKQEERPAPVGVAQLDANLKDILLIFIPKESDQYQIMALDYSVDEFPPKSCRILNFSNRRVVFAFGDKPIIHTINPNGTSIIRQDGLEEENQMVKVQVAHDDQGEMRLVYRSAWKFGANSRNTVFILPKNNGRSGIQLRKFVERGLNKN